MKQNLVCWWKEERELLRSVQRYHLEPGPSELPYESEASIFLGVEVALPRSKPSSELLQDFAVPILINMSIELL